MKQLWFDRPAKAWNEAWPIGNGRLGAMVFGGSSHEILQLNQDSMYYGGPRDRINPDAYQNLGKIRGLILEGKTPEAETWMRYALSGIPQSQSPYQSLGTLELTYRIDGEEKVIPQDYCRELVLEQGIVRECFAVGESQITKEYLASYPNGVIAVSIDAKGKELSVEVFLSRVSGGQYYCEHTGRLAEDALYMEGTLGNGGVSWRAGVKVQTDQGSIMVCGEHMLVKSKGKITLFIGCETSFYEEDWKHALEERLNLAAELGFEKVKQEHCSDFSALFDRVKFTLGEEKETSEYPPIDRIWEKGNFEEAFTELYFQYGRYLLISGSRPGSLPLNLQGIWNESMEPPWGCRYTININTQMNYWPAEACSLSECHEPLFDHLFRMWENGKKTAKEMYGCRGFVAHHNTDLWGDCAPQDLWIPGTYWVMGAAWLCTHIWWHYLYTEDRAFLRKLYPVLKDAVLFFHDFLIEIDGTLMTCPSVSPENTFILPNGVKGSNDAGSAMDSEILRDLMEGYLKASKVLGIADEQTERTVEILERLPKLQIGKHGQIMEWRRDYEEDEPGHRHISQLYALHPSHQITPDKTPILAEAAKKTLERRLKYGGGHTGWSCAWIVNFYARLGDGDKALENLEHLWEKSTFCNLMDNHPREGGFVFQIDGNLGACAAITELLVQSDEERILLLPALPNKWKTGRLLGVTAAKGVRLDLQWKDGKLESCHCISAQDKNIVLVYGTEKKQVCVTSQGVMVRF